MNVDELDDEEDFEEEGMTIHEIYANLLLTDSLILTTSEEDYTRIRSAIANVKGKENAKLKAKDLPVDDAKLDFAVLPAIEGQEEGSTRFQISLIRKKAFKVKLELPSDTL